MTEATKEYAVALYTLAREEGKAEEWGERLREVRELLRSNPGYLELLENPAIDARERGGLLEQALGADVPGELVALLKLLCERRRLKQFPAIVDEYTRMLDSLLMVSEARVVSAAPLTEGEKNRLRAALEKRSGHRVVLRCEVDESLIGGMTVEIDGQMADGSLRSRLREVKDVISS